MIQRANKYIDETAPWALAKDEANKARLESVLYHLCEALRVAGILLNAILPGKDYKFDEDKPDDTGVCFAVKGEEN